MTNPYRIISPYSDEGKAEYERREVCEDYDLLIGPDGWECVLTEPEDRRWFRDLSPVVDRLNELHAQAGYGPVTTCKTCGWGWHGDKEDHDPECSFAADQERWRKDPEGYGREAEEKA